LIVDFVYSCLTIGSTDSSYTAISLFIIILNQDILRFVSLSI
jgi:hypothetical protein